jgi:hypothetical protein
MNGAGPFDIQRVPQGLQNLLNLFGPGTPPVLNQNVQGVLELLQYYGLNQRTVIANSQVVATAVGVSLPALASWAVLYALSADFVSGAADVTIKLSTSINRGGLGIGFNAVGPLTITAGTTIRLVTPENWLPYPLLCPPGTLLSAIGEWNAAGNRTVSVSAEVGFLG